MLFPEIRMLTVVLHYGSAAMTRTVVKALTVGAALHRVLVLDNAAPEAYPGALRLNKNIFWGGALAYALTLARQDRYTHVWFCNNDIRFCSPAPHIPCVLGRLHYAHKILGQPVGVWAPSVQRNPYHPQMVRQEGAQFSTVAYVDGIAPVLNVACIDALGGPQGGLDMADNVRGYGLDVWLSLRAYRAGWPVVVDQQVWLKHSYHTSAKAVDGFMAHAAADEQAYMSARLGADWRAVMQSQQEVFARYA
ncbi:MAG: hypothetical protein RRY29_10465 [Desulfovibrionaceae bacterium]